MHDWNVPSTNLRSFSRAFARLTDTPSSEKTRSLSTRLFTATAPMPPKVLGRLASRPICRGPVREPTVLLDMRIADPIAQPDRASVS